MSERTAPLLRLVVSAILVAGSANGATGQQPVAASPALVATLSLDQALAQVLAGNADVLASRQLSRYSQGQLMSARGTFDARVRAGVASSRDLARQPTAASGTTPSTVRTDASSYSVSLDKLFRSGLSVASQLALGRTDLSTAIGDPVNRSSATVGVIVPLRRGRGGGISTANEHAADISADASALDARQTSARAILSAVSAYWEYRAAQERLLVYREAETRAERMVAETRVLIEADERPASDLLQMRSNLATKQATQIGAEQAVLEARRQLGLVMGLTAAQIEQLPGAGTALPQPTADSAAESAGAALVVAASSRRLDLSAARMRTSAADQIRIGASRELQSRVDLSMNVGYAGAVQGARLPSLVAPFYQNVPGMNASLRVTYELPVANLYADGLAMQSAAALEQNVLGVRALERSIESGTQVALSALLNARLELARAQEAVQLARDAVAANAERFRLGASTLFDVILAEDALTQSLLGDVATRGRYANALARLRYETGTLIDAADLPTTDAARFVRVCTGADRC